MDGDPVSRSSAVGSAASAPIEYERLPLQVYLLGGVMIALGLTAFILISTHVHKSGYPYLFLYAIPANTAISVFPHEPVLIYYGKFANLWITAAVSTAGTLVAGYLDHRVFVPVLNHRKITSYKENRFYQAAAELFRRFPFLTLLITGFSPIPFFPFKFLSFSVQYPLYRYLSALSLARFPRYLLLAWIGASFGIPTSVLIASVVVIFALYAVRGGPAVWRQLRDRRRGRLTSETEAI